jgi:hypothetical protein
MFRRGAVVSLLAFSSISGAFAQPAVTSAGSYSIISAGSNTVGAEDISDNGTVVGRVGASGFILRNGVFTPYVPAPVRGLSSAFSQIYGVNNAGQVVGEYFAVVVPFSARAGQRRQRSATPASCCPACRTRPARASTGWP